MKKPIETKKIFVTALIFFIALLIFPLNSFGDEGCVYRGKGDIDFLEFDFGPGLPLELPGLGVITVTYAVVEASGKETTVVTPFNQYIYHAKLRAGQEGSEKGIIIASTLEPPYELWFEFESARLFENFMIDESEIPAACAGNEVTVPPDVNLFFGVKGVSPIGMPEVQFNLILKIINGYPVIIKVW